MNITYTLSYSEYANQLYKFNKFMALDSKVSNFFLKDKTSFFVNVEITESCIKITENKSFISFPLNNILYLKENKNYIYILNNTNYRFIIPKSSFKTSSELNYFITTINNSLSKNDKTVNINKEFLIYKNKFFFSITLFIVPLLISSLTCTTEYPLYLIFFLAAIVSFIYDILIIYTVKKVFKIKISPQISSFSLDNNLSCTLNETTLVEINSNDIKKLTYVKNNFYIESNSLLFLNQCFFPQKHFNFKSLNNKSYKIKRNILFYKNPFWLVLFYISISFLLILGC